MKYYETHFEEYMQSFDIYNFHHELEQTIKSLPKSIKELGNLVLYGPTGCGKYTQALNIIRKFSPSHLKYDKKILAQTDKYNYNYRISDVHYEIDMSLLGCNSKTLWHEIFFQIVDIISIKPNKSGIILCKNFHNIHNELLEVFYSYIQHSKQTQNNIHINFILLTEHISFIPNNIINCSFIISFGRPKKEAYIQLYNDHYYEHTENTYKSEDFIKRIHGSGHKRCVCLHTPCECTKRKYNTSGHSTKSMHNVYANDILESVEENSIINSKEVMSFSLIPNVNKVPKDIFNIICNNIIQEMLNYKKLVFTNFRDCLYDILVYNLDITECVWYILHYFIYKGYLVKANMSQILLRIYVFLKYYNNNYRPIYHLESIFFYILLQINGYHVIPNSV